ncbi:MAG: hypothetical protein K2G55_13665 [Lachnospiraceae bacterium]|nr:hypothetical protein [Lachnospiraceae bacterium]MDE7201927.1 hypothetical protein [Lachnospiraceae bacterium]
MADYKHEISTARNSDISVETVESPRVQVAIGTAPVNLLDDPRSAVNVPILVKSRKDVKQYLGLNTDYGNYTLMQTTLAALQKVGVVPIIMINVLDPGNPSHVAAVSGEKFELTKGSTTIAVEGILLDSLVVSAGDTTGEADKDYIAAFDTNGHVTVAVSSDGAFKDVSEITIAYTKLNPAGVTAGDIIGGVTEEGVRTGIELLDEVYSRFQVVPDIISAPKYSTDPAVAAALETKAELIGDLLNAVAVIDIESEETKKIADVKAAKDKLGVFTRWAVLCWPKVLMAGCEIYASAAVATMLQYVSTANGGVPTSLDNKSVPIDGVVLEGGKEFHMTQKQVNNYLNAIGVLSFAYLGGWKCWGNNTAAYPDNQEPNNRYIKCVMMSNYIENRFKTEYLSLIGTDGSYKMVDSVVSNYNADLNALTPDYLAGAYVVFNKDENPLAEILEGHFRFHTRYADYTPVEYIENTFTWDSQILQTVFEGSE